MAAALSVSGCNQHGVATINLTGDTAAAQRIIQVVHPDGSTESHNVTCNGSGAASCTFVPQSSGKYTVNDLSLMAVVATVTVNSSHL